MHSGQENRIVAYIDGFNLYFGLKEKGWRKYYWLNLNLLVQNLLKPGQQLIQTKYFTARISLGDKDAPHWLREKMEAKRRRQAIFLEALKTLPNFRIYEGHYLGKPIKCVNCNTIWTTHEEKMTDVCIATELIIDAYDDRYDSALIISGDSDLVPPIQAVRCKFPLKRVVVAFPPERVSKRLRQVASAHFVIGRANISKSLFPDDVRRLDGHILKRPAEWK